MSEPTKEYWEQMRAHVDAGGKLDHRNAVDLLNRAEKAEAEARRWQENHKGVVASKRKAQAKTEEFRVAAREAQATADEAVRLLEQAAYHTREMVNPSEQICQWHVCVFCGGESTSLSLANPVTHKDDCPFQAFLEAHK